MKMYSRRIPFICLSSWAEENEDFSNDYNDADHNDVGDGSNNNNDHENADDDTDADGPEPTASWEWV